MWDPLRRGTQWSCSSCCSLPSWLRWRSRLRRERTSSSPLTRPTWRARSAASGPGTCSRWVARRHPRGSGAGEWTTLEGLIGCPVVAAAADGTALVLDPQSGRIVIRRPGGTFGAPLDLGEEPSSDISVAVAPGGWSVATWVEGRELLAQIVRPDGSAARTVVDRVGSVGFVSSASVGIDASGMTTIVWRRYSRSVQRTRVARLAAGGPPVPGADLPDAVAFDLAVGPTAGRCWPGRAATAYTCRSTAARRRSSTRAPATRNCCPRRSATTAPRCSPTCAGRRARGPRAFRRRRLAGPARPVVGRHALPAGPLRRRRSAWSQRSPQAAAP